MVKLLFIKWSFDYVIRRFLAGNMNRQLLGVRFREAPCIIAPNDRCHSLNGPTYSLDQFLCSAKSKKNQGCQKKSQNQRLFGNDKDTAQLSATIQFVFIVNVWFDRAGPRLTPAYIMLSILTKWLQHGYDWTSLQLVHKRCQFKFKLQKKFYYYNILSSCN